MERLEIEDENDEGLGYEKKGVDNSAISSSPPSKSEVGEGEEYMSEEDRPKKHRAGRKSVNGLVKVSAAGGKELWRSGVKNH